MIYNILFGLYVFSAFYKHGTPENFWYRVGKWSNKII